MLINGRVVVGDGQRLTRPVAHPKRQCEECGIQLSKYNPNVETCWAHSPYEYRRIRAKPSEGVGDAS